MYFINFKCYNSMSKLKFIILWKDSYIVLPFCYYKQVCSEQLCSTYLFEFSRTVRTVREQLNWRVWQHGRLSSKMEATCHSMLLCNVTATSAIKTWSLFPFTLNLGWLCYLLWPTKHMKSHYVSSRPRPQETLKTSSCLLGGCSQTTMEGRQSSLL